MSKRKGGVGFFLLFISILLCYGAIGLGIGRSSNPGPGFFPFLAGLVIAALSVAIIISSVRGSQRISSQTPLLTGRATLILGSLLVFGLLVEKAGFFACTFLATLLMLRTNGIKKWPFLLLVAFLVCIGIFLIFNTLLEVRLPLGVLRFWKPA